jgi:hypothetical protein
LVNKQMKLVILWIMAVFGSAVQVDEHLFRKFPKSMLLKMSTVIAQVSEDWDRDGLVAIGHRLCYPPSQARETCPFKCKILITMERLIESTSIMCQVDKQHRIHWAFDAARTCIAVALDGEIIFDECYGESSSSDVENSQGMKADRI